MGQDVTGLPMLLQGQQGSAPETVGGMTILNNNASGVMRRIARSFDDYVTEPTITRYYYWLQQYTEDPEMQFEAIIDARGSTALVERDMQNQWIAGMANFVLNPVFKINPAKWFEEFSKSVRFDPQRIQYTDAEWEQMQSQPPPKDPRVEVAEMTLGARQQEKAKEFQVKQSIAQMVSEASVAGKQAEVAARERIAQLEAQTELQDRQMQAASEREQEIIRLLGEEKLSAAEIKSRLLEMVTKDRRERDLFVAERAIKQRYGEGI